MYCYSGGTAKGSLQYVSLKSCTSSVTRPLLTCFCCLFASAPCNRCVYQSSRGCGLIQGMGRHLSFANRLLVFVHVCFSYKPFWHVMYNMHLSRHVCCKLFAVPTWPPAAQANTLGHQVRQSGLAPQMGRAFCTCTPFPGSCGSAAWYQHAST